VPQTSQARLLSVFTTPGWLSCHDSSRFGR
jgi:hypothetical protein